MSESKPRQSGRPSRADFSSTYNRRRDARRAARNERRALRQASGLGWLGGALLIALGALFLLQNSGALTQFANWWALFLLLPAAGVLAAAFGRYRQDGGWTGSALSPLIGGLLLLALSVGFLFGFDFEPYWPILLIAGGILLLVRPAALGTTEGES